MWKTPATTMDWERLMYDDPVQSMKSGSTVDTSQISDSHEFDSWLSVPSAHDGLPATSAVTTTAASRQQQTVNPVVPLVVEAKEAEDDDEGEVRRPSRRREDRVPMTLTAAESFKFPSSSSRQTVHRQSIACNPSAFSGHGDLPTTTNIFHQPAFIPLSVCTPKDEPQTVPCVADVGRVERKRERNRLAAQKCRQRKVEQISMLQERVQMLNRTKVQLERTADELRRQISLLQQHLRQHISAGCQLANRRQLHTVQAGSLGWKTCRCLQLAPTQELQSNFGILTTRRILLC